MNMADAAIAEGDATLLATAGDVVTFRGAAVSAVIDWMPGPDNPNGTFPNLSTQATSRIRIPAEYVSAVPKVGENITSDGPRYHRIQTVRWDGAGWILNCEVVP